MIQILVLVLQMLLITVLQVREWVEVQGNNRRRIASLRFEFLPRKSYKDRFCVTQERVLKYFENRFIHKVRMMIQMYI